MDSTQSKGLMMSRSLDDGFRVLVSAGSKHGSTAEIADHIAKELTGAGFAVTVADPKAVDDVSAFDAVILGSAVYAGRWTKPARKLANRLVESGTTSPIWLFSSGPLGDEPQSADDAVDISSILEKIPARDHRVFAGKVDVDVLSFGERAIMSAVKAPEGDFRDWDSISEWTHAIAEVLAVRADHESAGPSRQVG